MNEAKTGNFCFLVLFYIFNEIFFRLLYFAFVFWSTLLDLKYSTYS
jgi:hypothetical protein